MLLNVKNCNTFYYFNYQNQKIQLEKVTMKYNESQLVQAFISHCCDRGLSLIFITIAYA
jgi:hypothetical protein